MRVIHRQAASNRVAVVEHDAGAGVGIVGHRGMPHAPAIDAARLADQRANQIEVVNRMHQHFEARHALEERPVVPRRVQIDPHFDVEDVAEEARARARPGAPACWVRSGAGNSPRHVVFARGRSRLCGARRQGRGPSASESAPRRRTAAAQGHRRYLPAESRRRRLRHASRRLHRATRTRAESQTPLRARGCRRVHVEDAGDRKAEPLVHRQMRVANDTARADHDDRPRRRRPRPGWRRSRIEAGN